MFAVLPLTAAGLIHLARYGTTSWRREAKGQFVRVGRLLLDFVPASNPLDEEAISQEMYDVDLG